MHVASSALRNKIRRRSQAPPSCWVYKPRQKTFRPRPEVVSLILFQHPASGLSTFVSKSAALLLLAFWTIGFDVRDSKSSQILYRARSKMKALAVNMDRKLRY